MTWQLIQQENGCTQLRVMCGAGCGMGWVYVYQGRAEHSRQAAEAALLAAMQANGWQAVGPSRWCCRACLAESE